MIPKCFSCVEDAVCEDCDGCEFHCDCESVDLIYHVETDEWTIEDNRES